MIDKIDINERNNFTNENDVFNFVNLLFHHLYYGKDCEISVLLGSKTGRFETRPHGQY
jgi:hypothetical protein